MVIQSKNKKSTNAFFERFYQESQVLLTCQKRTLDDAITVAISAMSEQLHLQLYLKGIKLSF